MDGTASEKSWMWLEKVLLKKHTEGLIMAAQSQSIRTKAIKANINKSEEDPQCRMCRAKDETVNHLSECPKLAQTEYKRQHSEVAKAVHWDLCSQYGIKCEDKWYEHKSEPVKENSNAKLLWNFKIHADKRLAHNSPDIVLVDKNKDVCHIIDVACPGNSRIVQKEEEKVEKYLDLAIKIKALWGMKSSSAQQLLECWVTSQRDLKGI